MKQAAARLQKMSADERMRWEEEAQEKARRDRNDELLGGILKGRQQGLEQGKEQGKETTLKEVAAKLVKEGFDNTLIAKITGWTEEDIISFRKERI